MTTPRRPPGPWRRLARALRDGPDRDLGGDRDHNLGPRSGEHRPDSGERGSALVEFLGGAVVLLVPLVYLVLTLAQLQSATFAATAAARDAGRLVATADAGDAVTLASHAVELAFADQGIQVDGATALEIRCGLRCQPGDRALVRVRADVPLPLVPGGGLTVPVEAEAWTTIDPYRERP